MILELKPEQQQILERAIQSGMTQDEVLDEAFAFIQAQHAMGDWLLENREEINSKIQRGIAQAERGELIPDYDVRRILDERRRSRDVA